jgi:hypothetical protein
MFSKMHSASETKGIHEKMMPFSTTYEEVPGGARLSLTPRDPEKLEEFRSMVRGRSTAAKEGGCLMMGGMMPGMMNGGVKNAPNSPHAEHDTHHPPEGK